MPSDKMIVVAPGEGGGGQTHLREETAQSELSLPARQWRALIRLRYLVLACCIGIFLAWSPWSFLALGLAAISLLILRLDKDEEGWYCEWRFDGNEKRSGARLIRGGVTALLLAAWIVLFDDVLALAWPEYLELGLFLLPLRWVWKLHIAWRLGMTVVLSVPIWSYRVWAYRLRAEIADPSWSAPIAPRAPDTGPAFPGAEIRSAGAEPPPPKIVERPYPVPHPVPTQSGNNTMLPPEPVYDSGHRAVWAPSGRVVSLEDLTTFIRKAPMIGAASEVWKETRGWQHPHWQDIVDTWAMFGVMAEREERVKTRMLIEDFDIAMGRLSAWLNTAPPTPQED